MLGFLSFEDLDPNLHDYESAAHSGSRVRSRLKKWNELKPEWVAIQSGFMYTNIIKSLWFQQKGNGIVKQSGYTKILSALQAER